MLRAATSIIVILVVAAALVAAAKEPPKSLFGLVRSIAKDGSGFKVKAMKHGNYEIVWGKNLMITVHETKPFKELEPGTNIYALGRWQDKTPGQSGGEYPPMLLQIKAIIAAPEHGYVAPPIPPKLQKYQWRTGPLQVRDGGYFLEETSLQVGSEQLVIVSTKTPDKGVVRKGSSILMWGKVDPEAKKKKTFKVDELIVLSPNIKGKDDYKAILDLTGKRKPRPVKKEEEEKGKGKGGKGKPDF